MRKSTQSRHPILRAAIRALGEVPHDAAVVVGIRAGSLVEPIIRVDEVPREAEHGVHAFVETLGTVFDQAGVEAVGLLIFTQRGLDHPFGDAVAASLTEWVEVADYVVVSGGRFRSPACTEPDCCTEAGAALVPVQAVRRGTELASVTQGMDASDERLKALSLWRDAVKKSRSRRKIPNEWFVSLSHALEDIVVRDAVVVDIVPQAGDVAARLCVDPHGEGVRQALDAIIGSTAPSVPNKARLEAVIDVALRAAYAHGAGRAAGFTIAGLSLWWTGDARAAREYLLDALAWEPGYRLAALMLCAVDAGLEPGWKKAAQSAPKGVTQGRGHTKSA